MKFNLKKISKIIGFKIDSMVYNTYIYNVDTFTTLTFGGDDEFAIGAIFDNEENVNFGIKWKEFENYDDDFIESDKFNEIVDTFIKEVLDIVES